MDNAPSFLDEDGYFVASVPALPGFHTQAKTIPQLLKRVRDAIRLCFEVARNDVDYRELNNLLMEHHLWG